MFVSPEEPLDFIHDLLTKKAGELGLKYVAYGDEDKVPRLPAVKVVAGPSAKELHRTRGWLNTFTVDIWVYHGNLNRTHAQRSRDDLLLATAIRKVVHKDMTFGGGMIQGWIIQESPALTRKPKAPAVVGTRMTWQGTAVEQF